MKAQIRVFSKQNEASNVLKSGFSGGPKVTKAAKNHQKSDLLSVADGHDVGEGLNVGEGLDVGDGLDVGNGLDVSDGHDVGDGRVADSFKGTQKSDGWLRKLMA